MECEYDVYVKTILTSAKDTDVLLSEDDGIKWLNLRTKAWSLQN